MNMEPISILAFKWRKEGYRTQFTAEHVNKFFEGIRRNTTVPFRAVCITDDQRGIDSSIETMHLWENPCPRYGNENRPNCFYRLKCFDPNMIDVIGPRFIWMDLDAVFTGNIDHILSDPADLKMWRVDNEYMPCNGSLVLHRTGTRPDIWKHFNPARIHPVTGLKVAGMIGSDQAWIGTQLTDAERENTFGQKDGVYSYRCAIKKYNMGLPQACKIVFFHGLQNPWDEKVRREHPWVNVHYV